MTALRIILALLLIFIIMRIVNRGREEFAGSKSPRIKSMGECLAEGESSTFSIGSDPPNDACSIYDENCLSKIKECCNKNCESVADTLPSRDLQTSFYTTCTRMACDSKDRFGTGQFQEWINEEDLRRKTRYGAWTLVNDEGRIGTGNVSNRDLYASNVTTDEQEQILRDIKNLTEEQLEARIESEQLEKKQNNINQGYLKIDEEDNEVAEVKNSCYAACANIMNIPHMPNGMLRECERQACDGVFDGIETVLKEYQAQKRLISDELDKVDTIEASINDIIEEIDNIPNVIQDTANGMMGMVTTYGDLVTQVGSCVSLVDNDVVKPFMNNALSGGINDIIDSI